MKDRTLIPVKLETKDKLRRLAKYEGMTYDSLISRMYQLYVDQKVIK